MGYLGWYLYQRQHESFHWRSFEREGALVSIQLNNLNRFLEKANSKQGAAYFSENEQIHEGVEQLFEKRDLDYSAVVGTSCFLSADSKNFTLVFEYPDLSMDGLVNFLNEHFNAQASWGENEMTLAGNTFSFDYYGDFIAFSNATIKINKQAAQPIETNADFVVYTDTAIVERHLLVNGQEFKVWSDSGQIIRGRPLAHEQLIRRVPTNFEELSYFSSQRFDEDQYQFFNNPDEEGFSWIANQLVVVKKDSFEILLAPQNDRRNLKLILEEQTLKANSDSGKIAFFNLKNFQIMPFESQFNWESAIEGCDSPLQFYTEFEDVNVLANSVAALFWYLGEIQGSGLMRDSDRFMAAFQRSTPMRCHWMHIQHEADESIRFQTRTWKNKSTCVHTASTTGLELDEQDDLERLEIEIEGPLLKIIPHKNGLVVLTENKVTAFNRLGEKLGEKTVEIGLVRHVQLIDLENDGVKELSIIHAGGLLVFNQSAQLKVEIKLPTPVSGGMLVNYDQKYDYRFFLTSGKKVFCFNEAGQTVAGWQFPGSTATLNGTALYGQFNGRDYLVFADTEGRHYALDRRGTPRFERTAQWSIPVAANLLTGSNESTLSRLGYDARYIYNYYLKDGSIDSLKLDQPVSALHSFWLDEKPSTLVIEEPGRVVTFNPFGYKEHEVLKPLNAKKLVNIEKMDGLYFVFFDNTNNHIYLLNEDGKQLLNQSSAQPHLYGMFKNRFYTHDGSKIIEHILK